MAKTTLATIKAFMKRNKNVLLVNQKRRFDGMTDGCKSVGDNTFSPVVPAEYTHTNNMGYAGMWFVFGGRDHFTELNKPGYIGYSVYNCCGTFEIAVKV